ncbi:MAG TPA: hypothetical protein VM529_17355, partial [Gemmata sp.]|nr:hypothetical protein [Gemmata sp.]
VLKRRDATGHDHASDGKFAPKGGGGDAAETARATADSPRPRPAGAGGTGGDRAAPAPDAPPEEHFLDGLHEVVPAGQWHKAKAAVVRAGRRVYERMVLATPAFLKLQHVLTAIEGPDDLKQFGYKPMFDGTAGHDTPDAFADATGVGGTLGAKLAAHVLAKAVFWLKDRAGLAKAMHDGGHFAEAAYLLADVFAILAEEFGGEAPDAKTVEQALRDLDGDHDPHAGAAVALIDHAIAAAEAGEDVQPGLDRIIDLLDGGDGEEVEKASWDSAKHPRGDDGRFISRDAIADAKGDPAKEEELRKRVTDPAERKKLDAALGGDTDLGRTKRGQARAGAAERRKTRQASKEKATEVLRRIRANGEVTADDVRDLADHLPALTVAELRLHREALMARLGGKRVKDQYVRSLVDHARGKVEGEAGATEPDPQPEASGVGGAQPAGEAKPKKPHDMHPDEYRKLLSREFVKLVDEGGSGAMKPGSVRLNSDGELEAYYGKKTGWAKPASFENIWLQVSHDLGAPTPAQQRCGTSRRTRKGLPPRRATIRHAPPVPRSKTHGVTRLARPKTGRRPPRTPSAATSTKP